MRLRSNVFEDGEAIPKRYTADGEDISPPLIFEDIPPGTVCFALVMEDPDAPAGTWDHWVMWNIPADVRSIEEGAMPECVQGMNDFGRLAYGGPAPPSGTHTYVFRLYALRKRIQLPAGAAKSEMENLIKHYVLETAILRGRYGR